MKNTQTKILIVDDEKDIADGIRYNLSHEGFIANCCYDGQVAINEILNKNYSLIILDIMMPHTTGLKVLEVIRKGGSPTPVILLSAKSQPEDKVFGLELGADDYITKPFGLDELIARIKAVLRRYSSERAPLPTQTFTFKGLEIDFKSFSITNSKGTHQLSNFEAQILRFLLEHKDEVVTRDQLLKQVWGYTTLPTTRTIDNHIARLRKKVEVTPENPNFIITIHGIGYKFNSKGHND